MKKFNKIILLGLGLCFLFTLSASAGPVLDRILKRGELMVGISGR